MNVSLRCAQRLNITLARRLRVGVLSALAILALAAGRADAGVMLSFDGLAASKSSKSGDQTYGATGNSADLIEREIEQQLLSNVYVYNGAKSLRAKPENVGPAAYLGNSDWNPVTQSFQLHTRTNDTYLINRWNDGFDRITIVFDIAISSIEFDWQIFPVTEGKADITVKGDDVVYFHYDIYDHIAGTPGTTTYKKNLKKAIEAGFMGHTLITFATPVHKVEFIDWKTAPIGIDNLQINCQEVPEPATGLLALLGGLGIAVVRRRHAAAA